jgi:hypothetical protein
MRVAVIVAFVTLLTTPSEASTSCMSKTEAREHFGTVYLYWHGPEHCWDATPIRRHHQIHKVRDAPPTRRHHQMHKVQQEIDEPKWYASMSEMMPDEESVKTTWVNRWVDIEPAQLPIVARWIDIVQAAPPPIIERKPEPMVTPRGVAMVIITIALTLVIVEILFGGARSAGHAHRLRLGARP